MTKAEQTLQDVNAVLAKYEASEELTTALRVLLAPKRGNGSLSNTPLLDEEGNITHYWCRIHERYEVVDDMVMSNGVSKGQCKASLSAWTRNNAAIKKLESESVAALMEGNFEEAQAKAEKVKELKNVLNEPSSYNYDEDWKVYNANKAAKETKAEEPAPTKKKK